MEIPKSILLTRSRPASLQRQGMSTSVFNGMLSSVYISLTQGVFLTNFMLFLGADNFMVAVISAIPFLVQISYFVSPILTAKLKSRRKVSAVSSGIGRALWVFIGGIYFLPISDGAKIGLLLVVLAASSSLEVIGTNAWLSWMVDLVPRNVRGAFYSWRNIYSGVIGLFAVAGGAALMDFFKDVGDEAAGYEVLFALAVVFALLASLVLLRQHEPSEDPQPPLNLKRMLTLPWGDANFRPLLIYFALWNFSLGVASPFFGVYMKNYLNWSFTTMGLFSNLVAFSSLASFFVWGRLVDKLGAETVLRKVGLAVCMLPYTWLFTTPSFTSPAWINAVASGVLWSGFNMAAFNLPQLVAPAKGRQYYLGLLNTVNGTGMLLGLLVGGALAQRMRFDLYQWGGWTFTSFHVLFILSGVGRLASLTYFTSSRKTVGAAA